MSSSKDSPVNKTRNIIIIAVFVLIAVILFCAALWSRNSRNNPTQEEIDRQLAALATAAATNEPAEMDLETDNAAQTGKNSEAQNSPEAYLYIIVNGRISAIYPIGEEGDVTVDQGNGKVNVVHLTENGFYMASSTCDNQLCVQQGEVTVDNYQYRILGTSVLCLPNNVDLELVVPSHTPDPNAPDI